MVLDRSKWPNGPSEINAPSEGNIDSRKLVIPPAQGLVQAPAGMSTDGKIIDMLSFTFTTEDESRSQAVTIPITDDMSEAEVEDLVAAAFESFVEDMKIKPPPRKKMSKSDEQSLHREAQKVRDRKKRLEEGGLKREVYSNATPNNNP